MFGAMNRAGHTSRCTGFQRWLLAATGAILVTCSGCSDIIWGSSLSAAQHKAADDGRLVVAYYWSLLNGDCTEMDRTVFRSGDVIDTMAGTIPVRLDATFHGRWARELGIARVPSFVIYGPDGKVINQRQGAMNEAQFRAFIVSGKLNR